MGSFPLTSYFVGLDQSQKKGLMCIEHIDTCIQQTLIMYLDIILDYRDKEVNKIEKVRGKHTIK